MNTIKNIIISFICILSTVFLNVIIFTKYLHWKFVYYNEPQFISEPDIWILLTAIVVFIIHYFLLDRSNSKALIKVTSIIDIIISSFMLFIIISPTDDILNIRLENLKYCIVELVALVVVITARILTIRKINRRR